MAKKRKMDESTPGYSFADRELAKMNHRDLQKACIVRGMPFEDVVNYSHMRLESWFCENHHFCQDIKLLNEFDDWRDTQLRPEYLPIHSTLKMGFVAERDEHGDIVKNKRVKGIGIAKPAKSKRERDDVHGIFTGTKKALTFKLALEGKPMAEIISGVMEVFPQAVEKSIKIWAKKALKPKTKK